MAASPGGHFENWTPADLNLEVKSAMILTKEKSCICVTAGIYPAVDPLDSNSRILDPNVVGDEHYTIARSVQKILQDHKSLQVCRAHLDGLPDRFFTWN